MRLLSLVALLICALAASPAIAQPVEWAGNGHRYEAVHTPQGISWDEANLAANLKGGYLVTILSQAENDFVFSLVNDTKYWRAHRIDSWLGPWLGGYQSPNTANPAGDWNWITGEDWTWANWRAGEPNDGEGQEDRLCYFSGYNLQPGSWWGDDRNSAYLKFGYIVEYHTPEPCTLAVLGISGLALLRRRK